jgi:hypothetical protein
VDNKFLQQVKDFKYLSHEISYKNDKDIQHKPAKFAQILGVLNNMFKPTLVQKFSRIEAYNELAVPTLLMEANSGPLEKRTKKKTDISRGEIFQKNSWLHPF